MSIDSYIDVGFWWEFSLEAEYRGWVYSYSEKGLGNTSGEEGLESREGGKGKDREQTGWSERKDENVVGKYWNCGKNRTWPLLSRNPFSAKKGQGTKCFGVGLFHKLHCWVIKLLLLCGSIDSAVSLEIRWIMQDGQFQCTLAWNFRRIALGYRIQTLNNRKAKQLS